MTTKVNIKNVLRYFIEFQFSPSLNAFFFDSETWLRLRPLKLFFKKIDESKMNKVIDVGGASGNLELLLGRKDVYIYDADEKSIEIARNNFENAFVGSGSKIGFEDDSFDWAISVHTLEHIPLNEREYFILEMVRISRKGLLLNFPEGDYSERLCHNYLNSLKKAGMEPNKWAQEHIEMGLPKISDIDLILKKQNKFVFKYKFIRNYRAENMFWVNNHMNKTNPYLHRYLISPFLALYMYLYYKKKPTVEVLIIGSQDEKFATEIVSQL